MDAFISRKRRRLSPQVEPAILTVTTEDEDSTDIKIATLASLYPFLDQGVILEALLASDGSVELASSLLNSDSGEPIRKKSNGIIGYQSSLTSFNITSNSSSASSKRPLTKKGKTLHLYSPADIAANTPCSIIHNFLPSAEADALLLELLEETPTFGRERFKLFDRVVESPHTACFFVNSLDEAEAQKTEYFYNGGRVNDVRRSLPEMLKVAEKVQEAVNEQVAKRIKNQYPGGKKLQYQSTDPWKPNAAFVNCYDGATESVGYHTDQLTYLGPRGVIGSLSLGVAREFRVRRIVSRDDDDSYDKNGAAKAATKISNDRADAEGQISIHLPHNSLLVMHAEMQEEWKHSIAPALAIDPHPIAKNKRINITYRHYKDDLHPKYTPKCRCGIPTVLRCVQRKKENKGRYMWMCYANYTPGQEGCSFFQWAEFDDDGNPPWSKRFCRDVEGGSSGIRVDIDKGGDDSTISHDR